MALYGLPAAVHAQSTAPLLSKVLCLAADWFLIDCAVHAYSMISVPLYDTLGPDAVKYICHHAELAAVTCSIDMLPTLLKCLPECPGVKLVVGGGSCSLYWRQQQCSWLPARQLLL